MKKVWFVVYGTVLFLMSFVVTSTSYATLISPTVDGRVVDVFGSPSVQDSLFLEAFLDPNWNDLETRAAMEFDISGINPNATIHSVSLSLTQVLDNLNNATGPFLLYGYTGDGALDLSDVLVSGDSIGSFSSSIDALAGTIYDITLSSSFLQGLVDNGDSYFGLTLLSSGPGGMSFEAMEEYFGMSGPLLSVHATAAVPVPSTMLLLGTGLAGLVGFRTRRKKKA